MLQAAAGIPAWWCSAARRWRPCTGRGPGAPPIRPARLRALLDDPYGDRIPERCATATPSTPSLIDRVGPSFLAGVARRSRVVVVPDDAVAAAVRLDVGPDEPVPDVRVGDDADVVRRLLPDS